MSKTSRPLALKVGRAPTELEFEKSLMFFHAYMYGPLQGKLRLYKARGIRPSIAISPADWEVFASMLVNDIGRKLGAGIDLAGYEVKSLGSKGGFEYQYHKTTGKEKLEEDMRVGHLFFTHSDFLAVVELRFAEGEALAPEFFRRWLEKYPKRYGTNKRFRRSVSLGWVKKNGRLLMRLEKGEVVFPVAKAGAGPRVSIVPGAEANVGENG